ASGEASASLGFAAARLFDEVDPLEIEKNAQLKEKGIAGGRAELKFWREVEQKTARLLALPSKDPAREELESDFFVRYALLDSQANVLCPATKLWNTGVGVNMLREAVSLMGGYGITEDCPGYLANKWMDAQLEATYEGPEAVQRRQLSITMTNEVFLAQFRAWIKEMRGIASERPGTGACTLATAMTMWLWTLEYLQNAKDANGEKLYAGPRQGVTFPLADALCWLLASRCQILDVLELEARGPQDPVASEGLEGTVNFLRDLCHVQNARAAGEVSRICSELVYGYNRHPAWDTEGHKACFLDEELDAYEAIIPGMAASARDVVTIEGKHPLKAGPCAGCAGSVDFLHLQNKLATCLTGTRLAKDRAAEAVARVMIPEALDYPA
ncbi:MAG TPA: acyl-CoA dehydrogenase family protein, partial [Clostridia bacterium]|nr:acyl-CoA dehydrogenase family protein [Clostridia bacterium]